jgi:hypothetical protein
MATQPNYYDRNRQAPAVEPAPVQNAAPDVPPPGRTAPAAGDEPVGDNTGYGGNTQQPPPDVSGPSVTDQVSTLLSNGTLMDSPYYQQILQNQQKLIALRAQPTYVNKHGQTVQGMKDEDGRLQSGLKAAVERLAHMGPVTNWTQLAAGVSGAAGAGVAGAIVPEWNEYADRDREIRRLEKENADMLKDSQGLSTIQGREVNQQMAAGRLKVQQGQLQERVARDKIQSMSEQQKQALAPIMSRGYYYEGDNPDEDQKLAGLGVILPDFDKTRKPMNDNGVHKVWNAQTRSYEQAAGTDVDPDDQPIDFQVDGKPVTASTKWFINYAGAKERQQTQQSFQKEQQQRGFDQQNRVVAANRQMTATQLTQALQKYSTDNFVPLDQAKEAFRKAGVDVDGILKRQ